MRRNRKLADGTEFTHNTNTVHMYTETPDDTRCERAMGTATLVNNTYGDVDNKSFAWFRAGDR